MARHARPTPGALEHPAFQSARRAHVGPQPERRPFASGGWLQRLRTVAIVVLGAVVLGSAGGLLLTDGNPSAAQLPARTNAVDPTATRAQPPGTPAPTDRDHLLDPVPAAEQPVSGSRIAGAPASAPSADPSADPPALDNAAWTAVLARLDAVRSEAFGIGDLALLTTVYVDGSEPLERDAAALADLSTVDVRAIGLRLVVDEVSVVQTNHDEVVLRVVDRMPGYRLVDAEGSVVEVRPGRGPAGWLVTLRDAAGEWKIAAVSTA